MAGFLDPTYESSLTTLPNNHGTQTLAFVNNVIKGFLYAEMAIATRTITGQVKKGDGSNHSAVTTVLIEADDVITLNTGTLVKSGKNSLLITTTAGGVFQVTIAGTQGSTVVSTVFGGVATATMVGTGGPGGGGGGSSGGGAVTSVSAGSSAVSVSPTTGDVVVDVVEANFTGIPQSAVTNLVSDLAGKAPTIHTHAIADVTGLQAALDGKAALVHTHAISDVTGLQAALDTKVDGTGTLNTIPKWTPDGNSLGNSSITDDGTNVLISTRLGVGGAAALVDYQIGATRNSNANAGISVVNTANGTGAQISSVFTRTTDLSDDYFSWGITAPSFAPAGYGHTGYITTFGAPLKIGTLTADSIQLVTNGIGNARLTIDSSGNTNISGALNVDGNATLGNSTSADVHVINGSATLTHNGTASIALYAVHSATAAAGSRVALGGTNSGTVDCSAAPRVSYGVLGENTTTKSAGANLLTKYGAHFTATSGGANSTAIGVFSSGTEYSFWGNLGTLYNVGACQIDGPCTFGNASGDAHALNGTLNANSTAGSNGQILQIISGLPQWGAASTAGITSGSGTPNTVAMWTGTNALGDSTLLYDGSSHFTSVKDLRFGRIYANTPDTSEPGFRSTRKATSPGDTNSPMWGFGYSTNNTDFIWDYFNGTSWSGPWLTLTTAGALTIPGSATIGNDSGDAHSLTGTLNANSTAGTTGQILFINGSGLPVWGAPSSASLVDGSGTLNFLPKWTPDGNTLGNSSVSDDGTDVVINRDRFYLSPNANSRLRFASVASANYIQSGVDGTAGSVLPLVFSGISASPEWARFDVNGHFTLQNNLIVTGNATVNGNAVIGNASADVHTVNGRTTLDYNPTADTADRQVLYVRGRGTRDTTGANRVTYSIYSEATATESAGSNLVWNIAGFFTASGGDLNHALRTHDGDVILHANSGTTQIVSSLLVGATGTPGATLDIRGSSKLGSTNAHLHTLTGNVTAGVDDTYFAWDELQRTGFTKKAGGYSKITYASGTTLAVARSSTSTIAASSTFTDVLVFDSSGHADFAGNVEASGTLVSQGAFTANSTSALNGVVNVTIAGGTGALIVTETLSASTQNLHEASKGHITGTVSTVGSPGFRIAAGISGRSSTTKSAGTDPLINMGVYGYALGADSNIGVQGEASTSVTGTNIGIYGYASGGSVANYSGYFDAGSFKVVGAAEFNSSVDIDGVANGNTLVASNAYTGQTNAFPAVHGQLTGTYNTTSGALVAAGVWGASTGTRSTGGNILSNIGVNGVATGGQENLGINGSATGAADTNYGLAGSASGATTNYALYTHDGDVLLNGNSGTTTIRGNTTIGNNSADAHTLVGTLNANSTAGSNNQVLTIVSGLPQWATPSSGTIGGTGTNGKLAKFTAATTIADSLLTESGSTVTVAGNFSLTGTLLVGDNAALDGVGVTGYYLQTYTAAAATSSQNALNVSSNGTHNTTSGAQQSVGIRATTTTTRSSGANALVNYGVIGDASGGQLNIGVYGVGATYGVYSAGNLYSDGNITAEGLLSVGTGNGDIHQVAGSIDFNNIPSTGPITVGAIAARLKIGHRVLTATSSTSYTPTSGTTAVLLRMVGGGGGGGSYYVLNNSTFGGGGAGGAYVEKWITGITSTGNYQCGAAGAAGNNSVGGTGGDTTIVINSITYTAKGGLGGDRSIWTSGIAAGGLGQSGSGASSGGVDFTWQEVGDRGIAQESTANVPYLGLSGKGGSSPFGTGGPSKYSPFNTRETGNAGTGYGSGGAGHIDGVATGGIVVLGGAGTQGVIVIEEYC